MNETIISLNNTELTNINDIVHRMTASTLDNATKSEKHTIVICGRCGAEENYISLHQTICPNCHE